MIDLIIRDARIVDGSGAPAYSGDVAVKGRDIVAIGQLHDQTASRVIDASGLVAAPGFIDMHSHSDFILPANPLAHSKIHQGVTTEVVGNCGMSPAPLRDETRAELRRYTEFLGDYLTWEWEGFGSYLDYLQGTKPSLNVVPLVGQGTVRIAVMGFADRAPTAEEMADMKGLVSQCMDEGAFGISTGLIYPPGCYCSTEELIQVSRPAAEKGGLYFSHIRGEGDTLLAAVTEAITIGEGGGMPVQIAHLKASGESAWGKSEAVLALIDKAHGCGLDVSGDAYPYLAGSTTLTAVLPNWANEGGVGPLLERLADEEVRKRMRDAMLAGGTGLPEARRWDQTLISFCPRQPELEGLTIAQVAEERGAHAVDMVLQLLHECQAQVGMISFLMDEADLERFLKHPAVMIGSDGSSLAPSGELGKGKRHPRNYGTFPRVLARYVRDKGLLSLEEAVHKMTGLPAAKLGLGDRGLLREDHKADIVLFDPQSVQDQATFTDPYQYPTGVEWVLVNGEVVIEEGEHTGARPGIVLRRRTLVAVDNRGPHGIM